VSTDNTVTAAPPERAGAASAILETCATLGWALGIAVLGSIGGTVYRHSMADAAAPGVPAAVLAAARSTLGGATAVAARLPGHAGADLTRLARSAFTDAFQAAETVGTALIAALAVAAVLLLRGSNLTAPRRRSHRPSAEQRRSR
jgi:DHA2 family multidrug resistance protein-like MFS transporter